jgi:hypothetical protein
MGKSRCKKPFLARRKCMYLAVHLQTLLNLSWIPVTHNRGQFAVYKISFLELHSHEFTR